MRHWMVLAPYSEETSKRVPKLDDGTLERVAIFTSGDGDEPAPGDLSLALEVLGDEGGEVVIVPLDDAKTLDVRAELKHEVVSFGGYTG